MAQKRKPDDSDDKASQGSLTTAQNVITPSASTSGSKKRKTFIYGNYDRYYGYRLGASVDLDPRLQHLDRSLFEGKDCLDIGCNEGIVTLQIAELLGVRSITGVDIDSDLIRKARRNLHAVAATIKSGRQQAQRSVAKVTNAHKKSSKDAGSNASAVVVKELPNNHIGSKNAAGSVQQALADSKGDGMSTLALEFEGGRKGGHVGQEEHGEKADELGERREGGREGSGKSQMAKVGVKGGEEPRASSPPRCNGEGSGAAVGGTGAGAEGNVIAAALGSASGAAAASGGGLNGGAACSREAVGSEVVASDPTVREAAARRLFSSVSFHAQNFIVSHHEPGSYDVALCLSVTKWVHFNWGDAGIIDLFSRIFKSLRQGGVLVLEPQPWSSYDKKKKNSQISKLHCSAIEWVPDRFPELLLDKIGFRSVKEITPSVNHKSKGFARPLFLYCK